MLPRECILFSVFEWFLCAYFTTWLLTLDDDDDNDGIKDYHEDEDRNQMLDILQGKDSDGDGVPDYLDDDDDNDGVPDSEDDDDDGDGTF